jgi:magnesium-transporting ATPase (P-type)
MTAPRTTTAQSPFPARAARALGLDFPRGSRQPSAGRFVVASVVAVAGSVLACAAIAAWAIAAMPDLAGYEHFRFMEYTKLTVIGVVLACLAWPVATWASSRAWKPFLWLALAVTLVGLVPDAWILFKGQPAAGVGVLVLMHFALALITYPALVLIAPQPRPRGRASGNAEPR